MECRKCGSEDLKVMVDVAVSMPIKYFHRLSKKAFRDKEVKMWYANWPKADIMCQSCGYCTDLDRKE